MNEILRWLILTLLLAAAVASYLIGFTPGFGWFIALGLLFELGFWIKLFNRPNKAKK